MKMGAGLRTQEKDLNGSQGHSYPVHAAEPVAIKVTQIKLSPSVQGAGTQVGRRPGWNQRSLAATLSPAAPSYFTTSGKFLTFLESCLLTYKMGMVMLAFWATDGGLGVNYGKTFQAVAELSLGEMQNNTTSYVAQNKKSGALFGEGHGVLEVPRRRGSFQLRSSREPSSGGYGTCPGSGGRAGIGWWLRHRDMAKWQLRFPGSSTVHTVQLDWAMGFCMRF